MSGFIRFLGVHGSPSAQRRPTCIQVSARTLVDAGYVMGLGQAAAQVDHVFLTHAHLDHVLDLGFLVDSFFEQRTQPLRVYGLPSVLAAIKAHLFNDVIWPDFSRIALLGQAQAALVFVPLRLHEAVAVEPGLLITPVEANHSVEACGYVIERAGVSCLFSGDTYCNSALWARVNRDKGIRSVVVDVSFPNRLADLAQASRHLTPSLLAQGLSELRRDDVAVYVFHLKPSFREEIVGELLALGLPAKAVLEDGACLALADGALCEVDACFDLN